MTFDVLQQRLTAHANKAGILRKGDQILLAVSGGLDSVVMAHILSKGPYRLGIAHCNFKLRGEEADGDEQFVKDLAQCYGLPFYSTSFDTEAYANEHNLSIQMAARELRYEWLNEVRKEHGYHFVATAHHKNDNAETLLLNLVKGTGMAGLHGILPKTGHLIRPLLPFSRAELEAFAATEQLHWRTDASNASNKYQRNLIRNQVMPLLEQINPALTQSLGEEINRFRDAEAIYKQGLAYYRKKLIDERKEGLFIPIKKLEHYPAQETILFELLREFGFNGEQITNVLEVLHQTETKQFYSATHRLIKDRQFLIVTTLAEETDHQVLIEHFKKPVKVPGLTLKFHPQTATNYHISPSPAVAAIDMAKLELPLTLRRWQAGDYFYPIGLNKKKKLKRYLSDAKLNQLEKENTWVLLSGDRIIWLVGHRLDDRFKVTEGTKEVLEIKISN